MLNKNKIIYLILKRAAIAFAVTVAAILFISAVGKEIKKISDSMVQKKILSVTLQKRKETIEELRFDLSTVGENYERIRNSFPPSDNILDFVAYLENSAAQKSLTQSFKFGAPAVFNTASQELNLVTIDFTLDLKGPIPFLINYLEDLENGAYFVEILSANISAPSPGGWEGNAQAAISARLYAKN